MAIELFYTAKSSRDHGEPMSEQEWALRVDLAAAYRLAAIYGWDELIFSHYSARVPDEEDHFLLNPFGICFNEIKASDFVKIDLEGKPVHPTQRTILSAGFTLHAAVHAARPDVECVMHCHTRAGMAVAALKDGLLPLTQHAMMFFGRTAYLENEGVKYDPEERRRIGGSVSNSDITVAILRNHGLLVMGSSVADAFLKLHNLDLACKAQVDILSSGRELVYPPEHAAASMSVAANQKNADGKGPAELFVWPAMLRKLDKLDPSFRE